MKRLLLFLLFIVNLQIVIQKDGVSMSLFFETYAQHMDLEGGNYDCLDEEIGWYRSLIPCDGLIITPDETYAECSWCHERFSTSEIWDHEYICPERESQSQNPWANDGESNSSGGGGGGSSGGGSGGSSSGNSNTQSSSHGSNNSNSSSSMVGDFYVLPYTPIGYEGALIADFVYNGKAHWEELSKKHYVNCMSLANELGLILKDPVTGLNCQLLAKYDSNGKLLGYVFAYAGTNLYNPGGIGMLLPRPDVTTDIYQALFGIDPQYAQALNNALILKDYCLSNGVDLTFVGHSLGGGEAALASMVTGFTAITYNPAALSSATIEELKNANYPTDTSRILQYIISGEPVNFINDLTGNPSQGYVVWVKNDQSLLRNFISGHFIGSMIDGLK